MDLSEYVAQLSTIIDSRENYQRILGRIALEVSNQYGNVALDVLSEELKETQGNNISPITLRNYRWVEEKTGHLDLPEDISYRTRQAIAGTDDPQRWASKIKDEGISSAEAYYLIRGKPKAKVCPHCNEEI